VSRENRLAMNNYCAVVIETYRNTHGGSSKSIRARPLPGQGLDTAMNVECSSSMRKEHPVGSKFLIQAKVTSRENGTPFLYSHYRSSYQVLSDEEAGEIIKKNSVLEKSTFVATDVPSEKNTSTEVGVPAEDSSPEKKDVSVSTNTPAAISDPTRKTKRSDLDVPVEEKKKVAVGAHLLKLPRCSKNVVLVSPKYNDVHYTCEITVEADDLLPWAEHHAIAVSSSHQEDQEAREFLPIWLRDADNSNDSVSYVSQSMYGVLNPYILDFVNKGIAKFYCLECKSFVNDVQLARLNERNAGDWSWWTDYWTCPKGHKLRYEENELHLYRPYKAKQEKHSEATTKGRNIGLRLQTWLRRIISNLLNKTRQ